ncbi:MAG: LptF/LptG family permease [Deltaproteobacteria bacterium]
MTTFDRYLLRRYWHVFGVGFLALFGLYFVIDVFTNVTDFFDKPQDTATLIAGIVQYYSYRACYFFGLIGGTLEVVAAMVTMVLVQKHGELNPILSAGISTFRLLRTLLVGACIVNGLIVLDQELVIPQIAVHLQFDAGHDTEVTGEIAPVRDFATDMLITGKRLNLREQKIEEAQFVLSYSKLSETLTTIRAREAVPQDRRQHRRSGWLLKGASPRYDALQLTELGRRYVKPGDAPDELFIRTDIGIDSLYSQDSHYEYLPTLELMRRLRNPSFSNRSLRSQNLYLQARVTKPLLNLIVVAVGVPFVVRRESVSLITNMAVCCGVLGVMLGVNELFMYLGKANVLAPELAVWAPIIAWGTAAAWLTGLVRT